MLWEETFGAQLEKFLRKEQFIFHAPMSAHTTFKIGGEADVLIFPSNAEEVSKIFKLIDMFATNFLGIKWPSAVLPANEAQSRRGFQDEKWV